MLFIARQLASKVSLQRLVFIQLFTSPITGGRVNVISDAVTRCRRDTGRGLLMDKCGTCETFWDLDLWCVF